MVIKLEFYSTSLISKRKVLCVSEVTMKSDGKQTLSLSHRYITSSRYDMAGKL